ncbi:MAG TPA: hypothetical protein VF406_05135 [Thermodesulfobacteriota bacterium]
MTTRPVLLGLIGAVALAPCAAAAAAPIHVELQGGRWSPGGPELVRVRADGRPVAAVLAAVERATGVTIDALPPDVAAAPVTIDVGPLPLDRLVRQLVRPHGLAAIYDHGGRLARLVVVPTDVETPGEAWQVGARAPAEASSREPSMREPSMQARVDGTWWRLEDIGPEAPPARREAALLALGGALDDPDAVALLEAAADGRAGLAEDDPARRLARRILAVRPGVGDEDEAEPSEG